MPALLDIDVGGSDKERAWTSPHPRHLRIAEGEPEPLIGLRPAFGEVGRRIGGGAVSAPFPAVGGARLYPIADAPGALTVECTTDGAAWATCAEEEAEPDKPAAAEVEGLAARAVYEPAGGAASIRAAEVLAR